MASKFGVNTDIEPIGAPRAGTIAPNPEQVIPESADATAGSKSLAAQAPALAKNLFGMYDAYGRKLGQEAIKQAGEVDAAAELPGRYQAVQDEAALFGAMGEATRAWSQEQIDAELPEDVSGPPEAVEELSSKLAPLQKELRKIQARKNVPYYNTTVASEAAIRKYAAEHPFFAKYILAYGDAYQRGAGKSIHQAQHQWDVKDYERAVEVEKQVDTSIIEFGKQLTSAGLSGWTAAEYYSNKDRYKYQAAVLGNELQDREIALANLKNKGTYYSVAQAEQNYGQSSLDITTGLNAAVREANIRAAWDKSDGLNKVKAMDNDAQELIPRLKMNLESSAIVDKYPNIWELWQRGTIPDDAKGEVNRIIDMMHINTTSAFAAMYSNSPYYDRNVAAVESIFKDMKESANKVAGYTAGTTLDIEAQYKVKQFLTVNAFKLPRSLDLYLALTGVIGRTSGAGGSQLLDKTSTLMSTLESLLGSGEIKNFDEIWDINSTRSADSIINATTEDVPSRGKVASDWISAAAAIGGAPDDITNIYGGEHLLIEHNVNKVAEYMITTISDPDKLIPFTVYSKLGEEFRNPNSMLIERFGNSLPISAKATLFPKYIQSMIINAEKGTGGRVSPITHAFDGNTMSFVNKKTGLPEYTIAIPVRDFIKAGETIASKDARAKEVWDEWKKEGLKAVVKLADYLYVDPDMMGISH